MSHREKAKQLISIATQGGQTVEGMNYAMLSSIAMSLAAIADVVEWYARAEGSQRKAKSRRAKWEADE